MIRLMKNISFPHLRLTNVRDEKKDLLFRYCIQAQEELPLQYQPHRKQCFSGLCHTLLYKSSESSPNLLNISSYSSSSIRLNASVSLKVKLPFSSIILSKSISSSATGFMKISPSEPMPKCLSDTFFASSDFLS